MLSRAVNGFTAAEVDAAMLGSSGVIERRIRFDLLDRYGSYLRPLRSVKEGGSIKYSEANPAIRRGGGIGIEQRTFTLVDDYFDPNGEDNYDLEMPTLLSQITHESALALWRFGETSGTSATDSSGNSRTGTYTGGVGLNTRSLCEAALLNGSASFDGSNDYVAVAHAAAFNVSTISIESWIQTSATTVGQRVIERDDSGNNCWVVLLVSGELRFRIYIGGVAKLLSTGIFINDGIPHHIACTYDGINMKAYIDGTEVKRQAQTGNIDSVTSTINIGGSPGTGTYLTGALDEVAIYGYALSPAQVRARFQAGSGQLYEIDFLHDQVRPWLAIKMATAGDDGTFWAEFPRGVFSFSYPDVDEDATGSYFEALIQDLTAKLENTTVRSTNYTIATTKKYREALTDLFTYAGFVAGQYAIATSTVAETTLPVSKEYPIGTTILSIMNELLKEMNYRPARADSYGIIQLDVWVSLGSRATELTLSADENSIIRTSLKKSANLKDVYNEVVLKRPGSKGVVELNSTSQITNASHPMSIGRVGYKTFTNLSAVAASQTVLDDQADRLIEEKGRIAYKLQLVTPQLCVLDNDDTIRIVGVEPPPLFSAAFHTPPDKFLITEYAEPLDDLGELSMTAEFFIEAAA
jgi:hypothetical protein